LNFFLVAHYLIFSHNQPFRLGRGGCTWPGGDAQGGKGGCTCILCIPPGYAPGAKVKSHGANVKSHGANVKSHGAKEVANNSQASLRTEVSCKRVLFLPIPWLLDLDLYCQCGCGSMSAASKRIRNTELIPYIFVNPFKIDTETNLVSSRVPAPESIAAIDNTPEH
jgi:hypothetical protein